MSYAKDAYIMNSWDAYEKELIQAVYDDGLMFPFQAAMTALREENANG